MAASVVVVLLGDRGARGTFQSPGLVGQSVGLTSGVVARRATAADRDDGVQLLVR